MIVNEGKKCCCAAFYIFEAYLHPSARHTYLDNPFMTDATHDRWLQSQGHLWIMIMIRVKHTVFTRRCAHRKLFGQETSKRTEYLTAEGLMLKERDTQLQVKNLNCGNIRHAGTRTQ